MAIKGVCGSTTPKKQDIFDKFIDHQMDIIENIYKGFQWYPYLFIDPFSGAGYVNDDSYEGYTSSIKAKRLAEYRDFCIKVIAAEIDTESREMLQTILYGDNVTIYNEARQCLPKEQSPNSYGLVYFDPPMTKDSFELITFLAPKFAYLLPKCDILMYLSARVIHLFNANKHITFSDTIEDLMTKTGKDFKFVCEVGGHNRYAFILGTNFDGWANYRGINMYSIESETGYRTLKRLNYDYTPPPFDTYGFEQGSF